jgi:hypothetical protein
MAILAMLAGVAVLSSPSRQAPPKEEAEKFAARLAAAVNDSIVSGAPVAVDFEESRYQFKRFTSGEWVPDSTHRRFSERRMPAGVEISPVVKDDAFANDTLKSGDRDRSVRIICDPLGVSHAFVAEFRGQRGAWSVHYSAEGDIRIVRTSGN